MVKLLLLKTHNGIILLLTPTLNLFSNLSVVIKCNFKKTLSHPMCAKEGFTFVSQHVILCCSWFEDVCFSKLMKHRDFK